MFVLYNVVNGSVYCLFSSFHFAFFSYSLAFILSLFCFPSVERFMGTHYYLLLFFLLKHFSMTMTMMLLMFQLKGYTKNEMRKKEEKKITFIHFVSFSTSIRLQLNRSLNCKHNKRCDNRNETWSDSKLDCKTTKRNHNIAFMRT